MIFIAWLVTNTWAATAVERLCFSSDAEAQKAIPIVSTILVKGQDQVQAEGPCLNVILDSSRGELFQRWVKARLPNAQSDFSTMNAPVPECDMVVKKISRKDQQDKNGQVSKSGFIVKVGEGLTEGEERSFIKVSSGKSALLKVDTEQLEVTCIAKDSSHYTLKFALKFVPTPPAPMPPVVPGTVVVIQAPPPPAQSGTSISTEIDAVAGQDINLGQISRDLRSKQSEVVLPEGAKLQETTGLDSTQWLLHIR